MRDASLDDFFGGDESEADEDVDGDVEEEPETAPAPEPEPDTEESSTSTEAQADEAADSLAVRPAQATYDWSPAGTECAACGETVETRWHTPEVGMVCESCKEW